jgi:predicted restriction endonuclease
MKDISLKQVSRYLKYHNIPARSFSTKGLQTRAGAVLSEETKNKIAEAHVGKTLSEEHRAKVIKTLNFGQKGKDNPAWKGGITPETIKRLNKLRNHKSVKLWRKAVFERDEGKCVLCGVKNKVMHVDHIKPFSKFPELRTSIENGRVLCVPCHRNTDTYGGRQKQKLSAN